MMLCCEKTRSGAERCAVLRNEALCDAMTRSGATFDKQSLQPTTGRKPIFLLRYVAKQRVAERGTVPRCVIRRGGTKRRGARRDAAGRNAECIKQSLIPHKLRAGHKIIIRLRYVAKRCDAL